MATTVNDALPREMQQHTYSIMYEVEGKHWWFIGRAGSSPLSSKESAKNFVRKAGAGAHSRYRMRNRRQSRDVGRVWRS